MGRSAATGFFERHTCAVTDAVDFEAALWRPDARGASTFITLPFDVKALFGRARCPVRVTIGEHTWRTTTQVYGDDYHIVVNADARAAADVDAGDQVRVQVKKDDSVRATEVPAELAASLRSDAEAKDAFESLAPSHRREYARWVAEAKLPQTRVRRSAVAVERLKTGMRRPQSA
jgi:hypothetical protein